MWSVRLSDTSCKLHSRSTGAGIELYRIASAAIATCLMILFAGCQTADTTLPTVAILYPQNGATIHPGPLTIKALANDDRGMAQVEFRINNEMLGLDWTPAGDTYSKDWTAPDSLKGQLCFIKATAVDREFNMSTSMVSVMVPR